MIASLVLTLIVGAFVAYHLASSNRPPYLSFFVWLVALAALVTIWVPDVSTTLARWAGIGRGADLIIYLWMAISLLLFLFVKLSLFRMEEQLTKLARAQAISRPLVPCK